MRDNSKRNITITIFGLSVCARICRGKRRKRGLGLELPYIYPMVYCQNRA